MATNEKGFIYYALMNLERPLVKVGWSRRPDRRIREIATYAPFAVSIIALVPDIARNAEKIFHRGFESCREWGEWYRLEGALVRELYHENMRDRFVSEGAYCVFCDAAGRNRCFERCEVLS